MQLLEFENITMDYGNNIEVISQLSFTVEKGQIFTLLGPSGCGKSTILRLIAGLETPTSGTIKIDGITVFDANTNLTPDERKIGLVFQDYALFPHLSVFDNITFGLYGKSKDFKTKKANELLEIVDLIGFEDRYPHELSGGQQQRVSLARALATEPSLLLMDEPFSNLDTSLREKMRLDIYKIIKKTAITAIFVTHDQAEALSLSDQIAFLEAGKMAQVGTPHQLYWNPVDSDTASFMGKTNLVNTKFDEQGRDAIFGMSIDKDSCKSNKGILCIRPELILINKNGSLVGTINHFSFVGSNLEVIVEYQYQENEILFLTAMAEPFMMIEKEMTVKFDINPQGLIAWANK